MKDEHKQPISFISKLFLWLHHLTALAAAKNRKISARQRGSGAEAEGARCAQWVTSRGQHPRRLPSLAVPLQRSPQERTPNS